MSKKLTKHVLIVAGEASGDLHGANLVKAMKDLDKDIFFQGTGGDRMISEGVDILAHSSEIAVVGITEVFPKAPTILKTYLKLRSIIKEKKPDLLILIDYPDFNIFFAGTAKKYGIPILYYISPQIWASRVGRAKKISGRIDRMAVILPFEKEFYAEVNTDMSVDYVGHPLMDQVPHNLKKDKIETEFGISSDDNVIGLLPGSRDTEIKNLLPDMLDAAEILSAGINNLKCILPVAPTISIELVNQIIDNSPVDVIVTDKGVYHGLKVCNLAFVASGTATLEVAIMGVPMIITYRTSPLTFSIAKRLVKVPFIGLVNLVAGEEVVPELIQDDVTPQIIADKALEILHNKVIKNDIKDKLEKIKESLGKPGASTRTAKIAFEMMK